MCDLDGKHKYIIVCLSFPGSQIGSIEYLRFTNKGKANKKHMLWNTEA